MRRSSKVGKQPDPSSMPIEICFPTDHGYSTNVAEVPVFTDKEGIHGSVVVHDHEEFVFESVVITTEGVSCKPSNFGRPNIVNWVG